MTGETNREAHKFEAKRKDPRPHALRAFLGCEEGAGRILSLFSGNMSPLLEKATPGSQRSHPRSRTTLRSRDQPFKRTPSQNHPPKPPPHPTHGDSPGLEALGRQTLPGLVELQLGVVGHEAGQVRGVLQHAPHALEVPLTKMARASFSGPPMLRRRWVRNTAKATTYAKNKTLLLFGVSLLAHTHKKNRGEGRQQENSRGSLLGKTQGEASNW